MRERTRGRYETVLPKGSTIDATRGQDPLSTISSPSRPALVHDPRSSYMPSLSVPPTDPLIRQMCIVYENQTYVPAALLLSMCGTYGVGLAAERAVRLTRGTDTWQRRCGLCTR